MEINLTVQELKDILKEYVEQEFSGLKVLTIRNKDSDTLEEIVIEVDMVSTL